MEASSGISAPAPAPAAQGENPGFLARAWRGWPGFVLRTSLALLPLWWLWRRIELSRLTEYLRGAGLLSLAIGMLSMLLGVVVGCWRWRVLLRGYGADTLPPWPTMLRYNLIASYFNILPSGMAGDALRGYRVRAHASLATSYTVLLVERLVGLVALLVIAALAALAAPAGGAGIVAFAMRMGTLVTALLALLLLGMPWLLASRPALRALVSRVPVAGGILLRVAPARSIAGMAGATALSVLTQTTAMIAILAPMAVLMGPAMAWRCLALAPLAILATYIPITPGALGQRELVYASLFGLVGLPSEAAVIVSLIFLTSQLGVAAAGGVTHFLSRD